MRRSLIRISTRLLVATLFAWVLSYHRGVIVRHYKVPGKNGQRTLVCYAEYGRVAFVRFFRQDVVTEGIDAGTFRLPAIADTGGVYGFHWSYRPAWLVIHVPHYALMLLFSIVPCVSLWRGWRRRAAIGFPVEPSDPSSPAPPASRVSGPPSPVRSLD